MKQSDVTNDWDHHPERIDSLRSVIFHLISFEHLVDTKKQEDES